MEAGRRPLRRLKIAERKGAVPGQATTDRQRQAIDAGLVGRRKADQIRRLAD